MSGDETHSPGTDDVFDGADIDATIQSSRIERAGAVIGRYKLLEQIGEGGFGIVYRAEQREPIRREVALKIIKLGMDTREVIGRFEAERQALALMDHPNIATVLDGGATDAGRPYFVMELVRGTPITEHCDRNNLSTSERLELFMDVCHAVQHAHQKGVIHRDIKPNNVLVSLAGNKRVPKVIDFGIAKATSARLTEKTVFTQHRQLIGTPDYVSPEQAEMTGIDIDTRSDIYSLGVLLYELLTGTTPFSGEVLRSAAIAELQRIIREEDPPRPSTRISTQCGANEGAARRRKESADHLVRELRGDLDWIVMKAIEKDRTRRYETASGLADDIRRHLSSEPVMASPPSGLYRLRKLVARHRGACIAGAVVLLVLVAGLVGTGSALQWALAERHRANEAAAQAEVDATTAQRTSEFLVSLFEAADPHEAGADPPTARDLLALGATRIADLDDEPATQASLRESIGYVYLVLGDFENARPLLNSAVEYRAHFDDEAGERAYANALYLTANMQQISGDPDTARATIEKVLEIRRRLGGDDAAVAQSLNTLGNVIWRQGDLPAAEVAHLEALAIREELYPEPHKAMAQSLHNLGALRYLQSDLAGAEVMYRCAIEIEQVINGPDSPSLATTTHTLSMVYLDQGRLEEALRLQEQALDVRSRVMGMKHWHTALSLNIKGDILRAMDRVVEAEPFVRQAISIVEPIWPADHEDLLWMRRSLGEVLNALGRHDAARDVMRTAVAASEDGGPMVDLPATLLILAEAEYGAGRDDAAQQVYERARELGNNGQTARARAGLARLMADRGNDDDAVREYEASLGAIADAEGASAPDRIKLLIEYVELLGQLQRTEAARPWARELIGLCREAADAEHAGSMQLERAARVLLTCHPIDLRDVTAARGYAKRAAALNPASERIRETLSLAMGE